MSEGSGASWPCSASQGRGPARANDGCSVKAPRGPKAPRPPFPSGSARGIPCAGISWCRQQTAARPGRDSLPTEHPVPAAGPAPGQGAGWGHILCSPASCSPRPGWSSGAAGPPVHSGASCSGSRGSRSQPRSAKQRGRGKAGLHPPGARRRGTTAARLPWPHSEPSLAAWEGWQGRGAGSKGAGWDAEADFRRRRGAACPLGDEWPSGPGYISCG